MNENRRDFIKKAALLSLSLSGSVGPSFASTVSVAPGRIGIIGLDTSHSIVLTELLNGSKADPVFQGFRIVAAYPHGSKDIKSSAGRIPQYTKEIKEFGVEIVSSIEELLTKVDYVLLNTNDGRLHFEQALLVLKAGKRMFINKPFAASLPDVFSIFEASDKYKVPVFTSSSMRYIENFPELNADKIGRILGADTYSPATLEKTHTDLFWYGIHGVEMLYKVMGTGCTHVTRESTPDTEVVVGTWNDSRIGTFRGTRKGPHKYGGIVFGEKGIVTLQPAKGMRSLLVEIINLFKSGIPPVSPQETIELYTFMAAADESKKRGGKPISLESVLQKAKRQQKKV